MMVAVVAYESTGLNRLAEKQSMFIYFLKMLPEVVLMTGGPKDEMEPRLGRKKL